MTGTTQPKPRLSREASAVERDYRNVIDLFLAGRLPNFTHERHVRVANILRHLPYGRALMHPGLQVMAYHNFVPDTYGPEIIDQYWDQLDGTLSDPAVFDDVRGDASSR